MLVWDVHRRVVAETLEGHAGQTTSLAISRDGRTLYTGGLDGKVLIWDLTGQRRIDRRFSVDPVRPSSDLEYTTASAALSNDGRILAAGHDNGTVTLIDVRTLRTISTFAAVPSGPVRGMGYIPDTGLLVVGGDRGFLAIFDPDTGRAVQRLHGQKSFVDGSMAEGEGLGSTLPPRFSSDGRLMATADFGGDVLVWRLQAGRAIGAPRRYGPSLGTAAMALSPDGTTLVVSAVGIEVVDVASLRRRTFLSGVSGESLVVQFTPDGHHVIGG